jgi:hypothetical protein
MAKSGYVENRPTPDYLPLGQEVCTIGIVQPCFSLLPNSQGEQLGVPLFETLGTSQREVSV